MAYYYVKNGGTATGDGGRTGTQRTGAWNATASEYYDNIDDCVGATTEPTDGDYIFISDVASSSFTLAADLIINGSGTAGDAGLQIISVDDTAQDEYKPGAVQTSTTTSRQFTFAYQGLMAGVSLVSAEHIGAVTTGKIWRFIDCTLKFGDGSGKLLSAGDTVWWDFLNCTLDFSADTGGAAGAITLANGSRITMRGGSVIYDAGISTPNLLSGGGGNGGQYGYFEGVDLSDIRGNLLSGVTSAGTHDAAHLELHNCILDSGVSFMAKLMRWHRIELYNSDDVTGDDLHRFHIEDWCGKATNNDATYVTATETWYEGSVKSSIEVYTESDCSHVSPFIFELPSQYVDLSQAASDVITLDLVTDLTLTDTDIAAFLMYPDGTTAVQGNWVTTGKTVGTGNFGIDPLGAGATLSTSALGAGDWTAEPASPNFYKLQLDTTGDAGQACVVSIRIEVYKPSIGAGKLFIHPIISLG
jgi:hypothetical protein